MVARVEAGNADFRENKIECLTSKLYISHTWQIVLVQRMYDALINHINTPL